MATITLHGKEIHTNGDLPLIGDKAPDFLLVDGDLANKKLSDFNGHQIVMNIIPSVDTPTCATSTRQFNERLSAQGDTLVLVISADLPFAQGRFCTTEGLDRVMPLSMMRNRDFARDYGVLIEDGPLAGIAARSIVVLDETAKVIHTELVSELSDEPNYDLAFAALGEKAD